jgi:hypothetical protein
LFLASAAVSVFIQLHFRFFFLFLASAAVLESIGTFKVLVCRHGKLTNTVKVRLVVQLSTDQLSTDQLPTYQSPTNRLPNDQFPTYKLPTNQIPTYTVQQINSQLINSQLVNLPTDQFPTDQFPNDQFPTNQPPTCKLQMISFKRINCTADQFLSCKNFLAEAKAIMKWHTYSTVHLLAVVFQCQKICGHFEHFKGVFECKKRKNASYSLPILIWIALF